MPMDAYALIIVALLIGTMIGFVIASIMFSARATDAESQVEKLKGQILPFDRDGDGRVGGSRKRA